MSGFHYANKVWKERPPGPEQLLLEEMFENGSITHMATSESVRQSSDVFKQFSAKVFAVHFRKTKAALGEYLSNCTTIPGGVIPPTKKDTDTATAAASCSIPELGSNDPRSTKRTRLNISEMGAGPEMINFPYKAWTYTDHTLKNEYVCVSINAFTGCKSVKFDISEDGMKIIVRIAWASAMHNPAQMFNEMIKDRTVSIDHPMLHALASSFLDSGITENATPEGQWVIPLPCRVRREVSSYSMMKLSYETTKMIFIKMTAYQNDVIIEQANRTLAME